MIIAITKVKLPSCVTLIPPTNSHDYAQRLSYI